MNLLESKKGAHYIVIDIDLDTAAKRRFEILGMTLGTQIEVINLKPSGSRIIRLRGSRYAIGQDFAKGILIKEA